MPFWQWNVKNKIFSPLQVKVFTIEEEKKKIKIFGSGVQSAIQGEVAAFLIDLSQLESFQPSKKDQLSISIFEANQAELKIEQNLDQKLKIVSVKYIPECSGDHKIHLKYEQEPLEGSPFQVTVEPRECTKVQIPGLMQQRSTEKGIWVFIILREFDFILNY